MVHQYKSLKLHAWFSCNFVITRIAYVQSVLCTLLWISLWNCVSSTTVASSHEIFQSPVLHTFSFYMVVTNWGARAAWSSAPQLSPCKVSFLFLVPTRTYIKPPMCTFDIQILTGWRHHAMTKWSIINYSGGVVLSSSRVDALRK